MHFGAFRDHVISELDYTFSVDPHFQCAAPLR
jgi:hypothetical protein